MLLLEQVDRQTYAEMQIAATFMAAGAKGVDMPSIAVARERLNAALEASPQSASKAAVLHEALGLSRAG